MTKNQKIAIQIKNFRLQIPLIILKINRIPNLHLQIFKPIQENLQIQTPIKIIKPKNLLNKIGLSVEGLKKLILNNFKKLLKLWSLKMNQARN